MIERAAAAAYTTAVVVAADLPFHLQKSWSTELEHFHIAAVAAEILTMAHNTQWTTTTTTS